MEPAVAKDVWKSAIIMLGALFVMIYGLSLMLMWPVDSWDSEAVVRELFLFLQNLHIVHSAHISVAVVLTTIVR